MTMNVNPCNRCRQWDKKHSLCSVSTGAEHLPDEPPAKVPDCPIQDRCQHQLQAEDGPCVVRRKGLICESALVYSGLSRDDAMNHPLGFNAEVVASPEELEEFMRSSRHDGSE